MRKLFATAALLAAFTIYMNAQDRAIVGLSVAHLREKPDYTAEMGTEALMGSYVQILESEGYWVRVQTPDGYIAWVNELALKRITPSEPDGWADFPKFMVTGEYGAVVSSPSKGEMVCDLVKGDILADLKRTKRGFREVMTPLGKKGWVRKESLEDYAKWSASRKISGDALADEALRHMGIPYLWGGMSTKGFDCSGLTSFSALMNGVILPRNASQQAKMGEDVDISKLADGDCPELRRGDLLFFGNRENGRVTHVGIYIGDGRMVHASQLVRVNSLVKGSSDCYENVDRLLFAKRLFGY